MHPEGAFIPQYPHPLLGQPVTFSHLGFVQLQVEVPQYLGENEAHLCVRKLAADTITGPDTERLRCLATIIRKLWIPKPPLREEIVWTIEVGT